MDFKSNEEHSAFTCEPADEKELARMKAAYHEIHRNSREATGYLQCMAPILDRGDYGPFSYLSQITEPKFKGMGMCTHCVRRAAMLARDLANVLDDMAEQVEAQGKSIK